MIFQHLMSFDGNSKMSHFLIKLLSCLSRIDEEVVYHNLFRLMSFDCNAKIVHCPIYLISLELHMPVRNK